MQRMALSSGHGWMMGFSSLYRGEVDVTRVDTDDMEFFLVGKQAAASERASERASGGGCVLLIGRQTTYR